METVGGGRTAPEEWELPSEAFEQRQEILEGGRPCEDQLLVEDGPADQGHRIYCFALSTGRGALPLLLHSALAPAFRFLNLAVSFDQLLMRKLVRS